MEVRDDLLLPASILDNSPSKRDGVPADVERRYRVFACELVQECGILLDLPQVVMATAQTLVHRFYYSRSLREFDAHIVALGVLFLASKVEEKPRRMRDILNVCYHVKLQRQRRRAKPLLLGGPVRRLQRRHEMRMHPHQPLAARCCCPPSIALPPLFHPFCLRCHSCCSCTRVGRGSLSSLSGAFSKPSGFPSTAS